MNKNILICSHHKILYRNMEGKTADTVKNVNESPKNGYLLENQRQNIIHTILSLV